MSDRRGRVAEEATLRWSTGPPLVAHLTGELDAGNASDVFATIRAGLDGDLIVVDLASATFVDSVTLAELVLLSHLLKVFVVAPPNSQPRRVLEISGLTEPLPTFDDLDAAYGLIS